MYSNSLIQVRHHCIHSVLRAPRCTQSDQPERTMRRPSPTFKNLDAIAVHLRGAKNPMKLTQTRRGRSSPAHCGRTLRCCDPPGAYLCCVCARGHRRHSSTHTAGKPLRAWAPQLRLLLVVGRLRDNEKQPDSSRSPSRQSGHLVRWLPEPLS